MFNHKFRTTGSIIALVIIISVLLIGCQSPTTVSTTTVESTLATTTETTATETTTSAPAPTTNLNPLNPLTGEPLINASAEGLRPVAIMINNHRDGVPQIGIGSADLLYEMLVEGGITRMMAVFADVTTIPELGTIRSSRHDYVDLAGGLDAIYVHVGGSYAANDQMSRQGTPHIDLHVYPDAYWRDQAWIKERGYEHSVKTTGERLQAAIVQSKYTTTVRAGQKPAFNFRSSEDFVAAAGEAAIAVTVPYSSYCTATFDYDATSRLYSKGEFGGPQIDLATGNAIKFTNVILIKTKVYQFDAVLKETDLISGKGYYISGGQWQPINWAKGKTADSFVFTDESGSELKVNVGKSYIGILPLDRKITFK